MSETGLRIRILGDPVLRKKTIPVREISSHHRSILSQMVQLMYAQAGIGLAAPQVGMNESLIVADIGDGLYKLINPEIIKKEGSQVREEGCLSVPDICIKVKRAKKVVVKAKDEFGRSLTIEAEDLLACVLQHEIDHLKGKLVIDYASFFQKLKFRKKLSVLNQRYRHENLPESKTKSCPLQL